MYCARYPVDALTSAAAALTALSSCIVAHSTQNGHITYTVAEGFGKTLPDTLSDCNNRKHYKATTRSLGCQRPVMHNISLTALTSGAVHWLKSYSMTDRHGEQAGTAHVVILATRCHCVSRCRVSQCTVMADHDDVGLLALLQAYIPLSLHH